MSDTPKTDAVAMPWYGELDAVKGEFARHLERENTKLRTALIKARDMISSEYCSHKGLCAADNPNCYVDYIFAALSE